MDIRAHEIRNITITPEILKLIADSMSSRDVGK
jgi:hypothetical protein